MKVREAQTDEKARFTVTLTKGKLDEYAETRTKLFRGLGAESIKIVAE